MGTWQVAVAESQARERARTDRLIADLRPLIDAGLLTDSTTTAAADDTAAAGTTHSPREDNES